MTNEEAKEILSGYVKACKEDDFLTLEMFEYEKVIESMAMGAEALSKPFLPSNLDEAADDFAKRQGIELAPFARKFFKAGAEWMGGQGVNSEGKVFTSAFTSYVKTPGIENLLKDAFPEDTEVIVQIRKK